MYPEKLMGSPGLSRTYAAAVLVLYFCFLCGAYLLEIAPKWQGMGFATSISALTILLSLVAIALFCMAVPPREDFRSLFLYFSVVVLYIPALVYLSLSNSSLYASGLYCSSLVILVLFSKVRMPTVRVNTFSKRNFVVILSIIVGLTVIQLARSRGIFNYNFDIYSVYDFRREIFDDIGGPFNRFLSVLTKLLLPLLVIYAWTLRGIGRWIFVFVSVLLSILIFGYWQHKSAAFMPIFVLIIFSILQSGNPLKRTITLFFLFSFVLFVEAALHYMGETGDPAQINALLGRRILFVPPLLNEYYVDFFSRNPKIYWYNFTQHFGVLGHDYDLASTRLIGYHYFGREEMSANGGFIGSGYANAGFFGVVFYSIIIALILAYLNAQAKRLGAVFLFSLAASVLHVALSSSDLFVALRSHGLFLLIAIVPFLRSLKRSEEGST